MKKIKQITAAMALTLGMSAMVSTNASAHTVQKGETLGSIANSNGVSLQSLIANNPQIKNVNMIYVGETVNVGGSAPQIQNNAPQAAQATSSDVMLLAGLIQTEAGGESFAGQVAVGQVVMNRVHSGSFPSTVSGVIYQSGQFAAPSSPSSSAIAAAKQAMNSGNTGILYFYNPATASTNLAAHHQVVKRIGNHVFLR